MHVKFGVMSHTSILTSMDGVPAIIYWQGVNAITNLVQVAPAVLPQNDLIFLGEKSGDNSFNVLEKVGTKQSLCGYGEGEKVPQ